MHRIFPQIMLEVGHCYDHTTCFGYCLEGYITQKQQVWVRMGANCDFSYSEESIKCYYKHSHENNLVT